MADAAAFMKRRALRQESVASPGNAFLVSLESAPAAYA